MFIKATDRQLKSVRGKLKIKLYIVIWYIIYIIIHYVVKGNLNTIPTRFIIIVISLYSVYV